MYTSQQYLELNNDGISLQRYAQKCPLCECCLNTSMSWEKLARYELPEKQFLAHYYAHNVDLSCLDRLEKQCSLSRSKGANRLYWLIKSSSIQSILGVIDSIGSQDLYVEEITYPGNIHESIIDVLGVLSDGKICLPREISRLISGIEKSDDAASQWGNRHCKTFALMGFIEYLNISKCCVLGNGTFGQHVRITPYGEIFLKSSSAVQNDLLLKEVMRIPIIQNILREAGYGSVRVHKIMQSVEMSESTFNRRISAIKNSFCPILRESNDDDLNARLDNIYFN